MRQMWASAERFRGRKGEVLSVEKGQRAVAGMGTLGV